MQGKIVDTITNESSETKIIFNIKFNVDLDKDRKFISDIKNTIMQAIQENKRFITTFIKELTIDIVEKGELKQRCGLAAAACAICNASYNELASIVIGIAYYTTDKSDNLIVNKKQLLHTARHEIRHLLDLIKNKYYQLRAQAHPRIIKITRDIQAKINIASPAYETLHIAYFKLLSDFMLEGLAKYCERPFPPCSKRTFMDFYWQAGINCKENLMLKQQNGVWNIDVEYVSDMHGFVLNKKSLKRFRDDIYAVSYKIGLHMVYTIKMFLPRTRLQSFLSMSPFNFVRLYEQAFAKAKQKMPGIVCIVSLNSGQGIFDYNRTINTLHKIFSNPNIPANSLGLRRQRFFKKCRKCGERHPYDEKCKKCDMKECTDCHNASPKNAKCCPFCGKEF